MFNLYSFLTYIFVTAYTPGPNNIMSMSNSIKFGFRKSFIFNIGILIGFSIVMVLCTIFSASLYRILPSIKPLMLILGAAYILYLAWKTFKSSNDIDISNTKNNSFSSGLLLQFVNPKIMIYGITSMSTYILPHFSSIHILIGFSLLLAIIGFSGSICWSLFGALFYKLFTKHAKIVNIIMSLLLIYCAITLFHG